jgi:hypothetical protein
MNKMNEDRTRKLTHLQARLSCTRMTPHTPNLNHALCPALNPRARHPVDTLVRSIIVDDATLALAVLKQDAIAALIWANAHRRAGWSEAVIVGGAVDTVAAEVGVRAVVYCAGVAWFAG